jgi:predicted DNA-binding protein
MVRRRGSVQVAFLLPVEIAANLKHLSDQTRVSQAAYFREAIQDLLKKYESTLSRPTGKGSSSKVRK